MSDIIYGLHQNQPKDVYDFLKQSGKKLDVVGRFSYLPILRQQADVGTVGLSDGLEFIISDSIHHVDEPMMDGRTRRYAVVRAYSVAFGSSSIYDSAKVLDEIRRFGYPEMDVLEIYDDNNSLASALGINAAAFGSSNVRHADYIEFIAGAPRYFGNDQSILDAPKDGGSYIRRDGEWTKAAQGFDASSIDGGLATLGASTFDIASFSFVPDQTFDGDVYDLASESYLGGNDVYDVFGIDRIAISGNFFTVNFKDLNSMNLWQGLDRQLNISASDVETSWEGEYALDSSSAYSANVLDRYIHYKLDLSTSEREALADYVSSAGAGNAVVDLTLQ